MHDNQVFYDPQKKRWKRLRRIFDVLSLLGLIVGVVFIIGLLRIKPMKELLLPTPTHNYRALNTPPVAKTAQKLRRAPHRKTDRAPSDIPLNSGEGLRAAFYVEWDPSSYSSLKQHIKQIDLLFPEWLHVVTPDGTITGYSVDNRPFQVVDKSGVHGVDRENQGRPRHLRRPRRTPRSSPSSTTSTPSTATTTLASPTSSRTPPPAPTSSSRPTPSSPRIPATAASPSTSAASPQMHNPATRRCSPLSMRTSTPLAVTSASTSTPRPTTWTST